MKSDVRELSPRGAPAIGRAVKETIEMIEHAQRRDADGAPILHVGLLEAIRKAGTVALDQTSIEPVAASLDVAFRELIDALERAWDELTLEERVLSLRAAVRIARGRIAVLTGSRFEARGHAFEARSTMERVVLTLPESAHRGAGQAIAALRKAERTQDFSGGDAA